MLLRAVRPDVPRPYRVWGYPIVPAIFILGSAAFVLNTLVDFAFIAAYAFLWAAILRQIPGTPGLAGVTLVLAAACADIVEDVGILYGLRAGVPGVQIVRTIRSAALVKWGLLGVVFLLLAYRFRPGREVRDGWQLWSAAIALAYAYGGVLCLVGLFHNPVIERSALPISAGQITTRT